MPTDISLTYAVSGPYMCMYKWHVARYMVSERLTWYVGERRLRAAAERRERYAWAQYAEGVIHERILKVLLYARE